jgi:peptide/nickel transport system permease protein
MDATPLSTPSVFETPPLPGGVSQPGARGRAIVGRSPGQLAWMRLRQDRVALLSGAVLAVFAFVAVFADLIVMAYGAITGQPGIGPTNQFSDRLDSIGYPLGYLGGITADHWLGIEPGLGRDVLIQLIYGARTSLGIATVASLLSTSLGVVIGIVAGYVGGKLDAVVSWVTDVMLAFPFILFALAAIPIVNTLVTGSVMLSPSVGVRIATLIGVLVLFGWMSTARLVRGQVLSLREREFVEAARAAGAGTAHMVFRQLLPNLWAPILITFSLALPAYVTAEAALSFLNIGVTEPVPDWGRMIFDSVQYVQFDPAYTAFPGLAIFLLVLAFNLFGDSLRDALDPKSAR